MRPIDADALLEKAYIPNTKILNGWWHKETLEDVRNAPTIEPKRGRWIKLDMCRGMEQYKCSVCDDATYVPEVMGRPVYNFCPNCGAKMESEE